jgi:DNA modification methylase
MRNWRNSVISEEKMKNINIVYKKIDELKPYKNNPRKNDKAVKAVADSIKEFGFKVPIILDSNMEIIAGHTRLKAAKRLKYKEVPCIIADDLTPDQVRAFRLVDNKVGEFAEWDIDLLNIELSEIELDLTPFDFKVEKTVNDIEEDDYEVVVPDEPKSKKGDIYILGNHRLMCGDSTNKDDVRKLMNGNQCDMIFTDPPYNVNIGAKGDANIEQFDNRKIMNDNMSDANFYDFLFSAFDNMYENTKMGGAIYVCHSDTEGLNFRNAFKNAGYKLAQCLIWVKNTFVMSRQDYHWRHEPILYGRKEGAAHYFIDDRTQDTVWECKRPKRSALHPTMKPLELCAKAIYNSSRSGEIILDLFGGSGSTLIASEQLDRICYMMELDEKYVDVIIDRWEKFTGRKAVKVE